MTTRKARPAKRRASRLERAEIALAAMLARDAQAHPEKLGNVGNLVAGDDELLAGVEPEPAKTATVVGDIRAERRIAYRKRGEILEAQGRAQAFNAEGRRDEDVQRLRLLLAHLLVHVDHEDDCRGCAAARAAVADENHATVADEGAQGARVAARMKTKRR